MPKTPQRTRRSRPGKQKPHKDFPLTRHPRGYWCKKVRGKLVYFGRIDADPDGAAALAKWLDEKDDLLAGRTPRRTTGDGCTVSELCNKFLAHKRNLADSGEITPRTFGEYVGTCQRVAKAFGRNRLVDDLSTDDFENLRAAVAKVWGPVRLGNEVQRVRSVFKYGYDAALLDKPVRYGPAFKAPSRKVLRIARAKAGPKLLEARHVRRLLKAASVPMRAMILLAVNGGLGNTDCAMLTRDKLDLRGKWLDYPRGKTGVSRRVPLWVETVSALEAALAARPTPKDPAHADLVFVTKYGKPWGSQGASMDNGTEVKEVIDSPITKEFRKLLDDLDLHRKGLGFYTLRHVHRTIADRSRDRTACDSIMGHVDSTMAGVYVEAVEDSRLVAVVEHVRRWLFRGANGKVTGKVKAK